MTTLTPIEHCVLGAVIDITRGARQLTRVALTALTLKANRVAEEERVGTIPTFSQSDVELAAEALATKGEIIVCVSQSGTSYALTKPYREYERVKARRKKKYEYRKEAKAGKWAEVGV